MEKEKMMEKIYPSKLELEALNDISAIANKNNFQFKFDYTFHGKEDNNSYIRMDSKEVNGMTALIALTTFSNGNLSRLDVRYNTSFSNELTTELRNYEEKYKERNYIENIKNQEKK